MVENLTQIKIEELLNYVSAADRNGYRFITATCANAADNKIEVTYHFDRNFEMLNYRLSVTTQDEIPSISNIYLCAVLIENEMKELFALNLKGIAIDYGGHFLLSDDELTGVFNKPQIIVEKREKGGGKNV
jgi:ech hydrogenase subunit D